MGSSGHLTQDFHCVVNTDRIEPSPYKWSKAFLEKIGDPNWLPGIAPLPAEEANKND
jgi:hypothetical protein